MAPWESFLASGNFFYTAWAVFGTLVIVGLATRWADMACEAKARRMTVMSRGVQIEVVAGKDEEDKKEDIVETNDI
ncbi:hypothetical protein DFJ74DRAFT_665464 [Hyaloraphidium curvatum]|nr:hypothetical protein DFJ74DRAFT_665464 [Hyaloraphidium curvatum]